MCVPRECNNGAKVQSCKFAVTTRNPCYFSYYFLKKIISFLVLKWDYSLNLENCIMQMYKVGIYLLVSKFVDKRGKLFGDVLDVW